MYATNRQSRSLLMSAPRVHWANGLGCRTVARVRPAAAEDVAWVDAEQQREHQTISPAPPPMAILPPLPSAAAAHLRRVELGALVVLHARPPLVRDGCPPRGSVLNQPDLLRRRELAWRDCR